MKTLEIINNKKYYIDSDSVNFEYRSHINGLNCTCPDNWVAARATDDDGTEYILWYYVSDEDFNTDGWDLSCINYSEPNDIEHDPDAD